MNTNNTNINDPPPPPPQTNAVRRNAKSAKRYKNWKKKDPKRQEKRAEEKEEMQRQLENLPQRVPIPELLPELITKIFSLLDPFMKANCHLVCKSWRFWILLDPLLHKELDLSKLGEATPIISFFNHFDRLSFHAGDRLVKVSLDLSCFWLDCMRSNGQAYEDSACYDLFQTSLFKSKDSLQEISLRFVEPDLFDSEIYFSSLLRSILPQLQSYPFLRSIFIEGPAGFSCTLESADGSRTFQIIDNKSNEAGWDSEEDSVDEKEANAIRLGPIIDYGKKLVGTGAEFTQFNTSDALVKFNQQSTDTLSGLLKTSTATMKDFELEANTVALAEAMWNIVIQCTNLKKLNLDLSAEAEETVLHLESPAAGRINQALQCLHLTSQGYTVAWDELSNWVGSSLKDLQLYDFQDSHGRGSLMKGPSDLISIFKKTSGTLTRVSLCYLYPNEIDGEAVTILKSMPNLKSLELTDLHSSFFDFFNAPFVYPSLQELTISSEEFSQSAFDCFLAILKANSSSLVEVEFKSSSHGAASPGIPSETLILNFDNLETLEFGWDDKEVGIWFSTLSNNFPRLSTLHLQSLKSVHEAFSLKAPQLSEYNPPSDGFSDDSLTEDSSED